MSTQFNFHNNCLLEDTVPEGIEIRKIENFGHGLFATQSFPKGSVVFKGRQFLIPDDYVEFTLKTPKATYSMNTTTHSVQVTETERLLFLFDAFTNHSCDPTTICLYDSYEGMKNNEFTCFALKDIKSGDPINSDYNIFEYDCEGKQFDKCMCGSGTCCLGGVYGYKYLTREQQKERYSQLNIEVLRRMALHSENKMVFIEHLEIPDGVALRKQDHDGANYKLMAMRDFKKGERVCSYACSPVESDHVIVVELANYERVWIDPELGPCKRDFHGFAHFQQHADNPNTYRVEGKTQCELVASKDIQMGEELTI